MPEVPEEFTGRVKDEIIEGVVGNLVDQGMKGLRVGYLPRSLSSSPDSLSFFPENPYLPVSVFYHMLLLFSPTLRPETNPPVGRCGRP